MTPDLDEIERRALAATQGEWTNAAHIDSYANVTLALVARIRELEGEAARREVALKPFATLYGEVADMPYPANHVAWGFNEAHLTWGDFARAHAALHPTDPTP